MLILEQNYTEAEPAILRAIAYNRNNPKYLNAIGVLNEMKGDHSRALAAYQMAIDADENNGFAWYNMAVILYNQSSLQDAAIAFRNAGAAYIKLADYAKAERALSDIEDLRKLGQNVAHIAKELREALENSTRRKP